MVEAIHGGGAVVPLDPAGAVSGMSQKDRDALAEIEKAMAKVDQKVADLAKLDVQTMDLMKQLAAAQQQQPPDRAVINVLMIRLTELSQMRQLEKVEIQQARNQVKDLVDQLGPCSGPEARELAAKTAVQLSKLTEDLEKNTDTLRWTRAELNVVESKLQEALSRMPASQSEVYRLQGKLAELENQRKTLEPQIQTEQQDMKMLLELMEKLKA